MKDIKLTLSKDPTMRSPNVIEEAKWLEKEGAIYYQLQGFPRQVEAGCYVYFIRNGAIVGRAIAEEFLYMKLEDLGGSYTGVPSTKGGIRVKVVPPMEVSTKTLFHDSFQGFRYVKEEEQESFEDAFKS